MKRYTVYLNEQLDGELRDISEREGTSLNELLRRRLETSLRASRSEIRIKTLEGKVDAIYAVLDLMAGELGYVAGATRASTKNHEQIRNEGVLLESHIKRITTVLSKSFERDEEEV